VARQYDICATPGAQRPERANRFLAAATGGRCPPAAVILRKGPMTAALPTATIVPRRTLSGSVAGVYIGTREDDLTSEPLAELRLDLAGVVGDRHYGFTRRAGSREPWYPRGSEMRSGRQVTIVSVEELAEIAERMGLAELRPEWIGANIAVAGIPRLTQLPAGTRLRFPGAAVVVEGANAPCRIAGKAIARHAGKPDAELAFAKVAAGLRGVVASVERAGVIAAGDAVQVRIPEQRLYL